MPYPHLSRVTYGLTGDLTFELPARPWIPADETVGGRRIASSGIAAAYVVRRDDLLEVPLRFHEAYWNDVIAFLQYGQSQEVIRWYPDSTLTDEDYDSVAVYLHSPAMGERFAPTRDGQYQRMLEITITLRAVSTTAWSEYFPAD
jgi:hypothetical protein